MENDKKNIVFVVKREGGSPLIMEYLNYFKLTDNFKMTA